LEIHPSYAKALFYLGKLHVKKHRHSEAREALKKAIELDPNFLEIYELLALTLERTNDIDELEDVLNKGQKRFPNNIHLLLPMAKLLRRQKKYDEAEQSLDRIKEQANSKERISTIYAELGRIYEAQKRYDDAFMAFSISQKNLKEAQEETGGAKDHYLNLRQAAIGGITEESIKDWEQYEFDDGLPPLFLVGFPRSGTTLMEQILSSHPSIVASQEASILDGLIFNMANIIGRKLSYPSDLRNLTKEEITKLRANYRKGLENLFGEEMSGKRIIDKLPYNIVHLGIIYRLFPEAKIIVMLRDPRDACLSCFMQTFRKNSAMKYSHSLDSTAFLYDKTMEAYNYFKKFIPVEILEIRYEDLIDDLEGKARKALEFYGLDWNNEVLNYYKKGKDRGVSTPSYEGVMKPIYKSSAGKWKNYEKYFGNALPILAPYIKEYGYES
jgi:tetratricopeptide (TPR) repeat protein